MSLIDPFFARLASLRRQILKRMSVAENRAHLAKLKSCGKNVRINGSLRISGHKNIVLGKNVHIGEGAFIKGEGGLVIGDNTHISRNLLLYTTNHQYEGKRLPYDEKLVVKPVVIGQNVWVGMNVSIAPGTTIGEGAIIGMGTVVSGEVPPLSIIGSEKWRVLGRRDEVRYRTLETQKSYGGPSGRSYS